MSDNRGGIKEVFLTEGKKFENLTFLGEFSEFKPKP